MDQNTFHQGVPGANASGGPAQQQFEHQQLIQHQLFYQQLLQQQLAHQQHIQQHVHQLHGQQQQAPQKAIVGWAARPVLLEVRPVYAGEEAPGSPGGGGPQLLMRVPASAGPAGPPGFGAMPPMSPSRHGSMNLGMGMGLPPLPGPAFGMGMMPTAGPNGVGVDPNGGVGNHNMRHPSQPQLYQFVPHASHPGVANAQAQAAANGPPSASPLTSTFRFSPSASSFQPYQCGGVVFAPSSATLQPQNSAEFANARDLPPPPAVLPGPAMAYSQTKARAQQHRPHPLSMHTVLPSSSAQDGDRQQPKSGHLQQPKPRHPQHGRNSSLIHSAPAVQRYAVRRVVTPEPSDYGYGGYGSAYSTSPLASESRRKILRHYAQKKRAASPGSSQYDDEEEDSTDGDEDDGPADGLSDNASYASERRPVAVAKKSLKPSSSESTLVPGRRMASSRWMRRESSMSAGVLVAAGPSRVATVVSDDDPSSSPTPVSRAARIQGPARPVAEHNHHHHNHHHGHRHAHQSQALTPRGPQPPPRPESSSDGADRDASSCASSEGWSSSATAGDNYTHGPGCTCGLNRCAQCGMYVSPGKHQCPAGGSQPLQG